MREILFFVQNITINFVGLKTKCDLNLVYLYEKILELQKIIFSYEYNLTHF